MHLFLNTFIVVFLFLVFLQDIKYRAIHVGLPLLIFLIGFYLFYIDGNESIIILKTLAFLLITFFGLYVYLFLKYKRLINPFKSIGLGDFLFFIAVIPYFSTLNYILYFVSGMIFSIFSFLIIKSISKTELVPLAGLLALYMIFLKVIFYIAQLDFIKTKLF